MKKGIFLVVFCGIYLGFSNLLAQSKSFEIKVFTKKKIADSDVSILAWLNPLIDQEMKEVEGKKSNLIMTKTDEGLYISFSCRSKKAYNDEKFCETISEKIKKKLESTGNNVEKVNCN